MIATNLVCKKARPFMESQPVDVCQLLVSHGTENLACSFMIPESLDRETYGDDAAAQIAVAFTGSRCNVLERLFKKECMPDVMAAIDEYLDKG